MAMNTGGYSNGPMAEINVTPLVDVMLVLLIIFMITAPLLTHRVIVELPRANPKITAVEKIEPMDLAIKADGTMYLNDHKVAETELAKQLAVAAAQIPQAELQIRADRTIKYKRIRTILGLAKAQGMFQIGFVTTDKE